MDPQTAHEAARSVDRLPMRPAEWVDGVRVPGTKWVVQGRLGQGGMGIVFEVRKEPAGISGAMKVMHSAVASKPSLASRFLLEGRLLASIRHRNIVEVIDYDMLQDGTPFMVMELLRGRTLRGSLRDNQLGGAKLPARNMYDIGSQLCAALHVLHSQQPAIVHRDVKPENIFLHRLANAAGGGTVKLLDFGLAGAAGQWSRHVLGTPRYLSPEQVLGRPVTERSDQYSAALVLYEMIAGRFPWDVDVQNVEAMIDAHVNLAPAPPSRFCPWVSRRLDEVLLRALAKDPGARWASVDQVAEGARELEDINDGSAYANVDANTTAPTLATLADAMSGEDLMHDTEQRMNLPLIEGRSLELVPLALLNVNGSDEHSRDGASTESDELLGGLAPRSDRAPARVAPVADFAPRRQACPVDDVGIHWARDSVPRPDGDEEPPNERPRSSRVASMQRTQRSRMRFIFCAGTAVAVVVAAAFSVGTGRRSRDTMITSAAVAPPLVAAASVVGDLSSSQLAPQQMSLPPWALFTNERSIESPPVRSSKRAHDSPVAHSALNAASTEKGKIAIGAVHVAPKVPRELFTWDVSEERSPPAPSHAPKATAPPAPDDGRGLSLSTWDGTVAHGAPPAPGHAPKATAPPAPEDGLDRF